MEVSSECIRGKKIIIKINYYLFIVIYIHVIILYQ
jgi:hypothetical protein